MSREKPEGERLEILQGTLDMVILKSLQAGTQHGYGLAQSIRTRSGDLLQVETGSLYPALHRLEKRGWISSEWKLTEAAQRAKFYKLTAAGKKQLVAEQNRWAKFVGAISGILNPAEER